MMMADNGVVTEWQSYLAQSRDGEGRRPREVLDRIRGLPLQGRQPAARHEARRRRSARARVLTRTPVRAIAIDRSRRARHAGRRQGARGRARAAHRAAERVEQDRDRSGAAGGAGAADGHERQVPDGAEVAVWRRTELAPELLSRRPGVDDVARDRRPARRRRGAGRVLRRPCRRCSAASGPPHSAIATTWRS